MKKNPSLVEIQSKRVLSLAEASKFTGYKISYLYRLTALGEIPFSKPRNGKLFFDREVLEKWMLGTLDKNEEREQAAATYLATH